MNVKEMREKYPPGTAVILHEMKGEPQMREGLKGIVTDVDDAGQIHVKWESGSSLALTEADRFEVEKKIRVILCRPGKRAEAAEIGENLEAMQETVGGMIEEYMPFPDDVAIVCNDEGKMRRMPLNRGIFDEKGTMLDVIAGPFFICYAPVENERFLSLPPDLEAKYLKMFELPERFYRTARGIEVQKYEPIEAERGLLDKQGEAR